MAFAGAQAYADDVEVIRIGRQVFITGGDGPESLVVSLGAPAELVVATGDGATTVQGGTEFRLFVGERDTVYFMLAGGLNTVDVNSLPELRRVMVLTGGSAANSFDFSGATIPGDLIFSGGPGADALTAAGATVLGNLFAFMGAGPDTVTLDGLEVEDEAVVDLGDGLPNVATLNAVLAHGPFVVLGGSDDDVVTITAGIYERPVRVELGDGADALTIGGAAEFLSRVTLLTGRDDDSVVIDQDPRFRLRASLDTGDGDDVVSVGASRFGETFRVRLGDDDDDITIGGVDVTTRFAVLAGTGDDVVRVVPGSQAGIRPAGALLRGGDGTDVLEGQNGLRNVSVVEFERFRNAELPQ
jgi:hypothetical protein